MDVSERETVIVGNPIFPRLEAFLSEQGNIHLTFEGKRTLLTLDELRQLAEKMGAI